MISSFITRMHLGYNIKRIREMKGYSQKAIAEKLGMSITGYGNIERGISDVKDKRLIAIAKALDVTMEAIQDFNPDTYFDTSSSNKKDVLINSAEKELYEKIIQQKDEEIAYLRNLLKKKFK